MKISPIDSFKANKNKLFDYTKKNASSDIENIDHIELKMN